MLHYLEKNDWKTGLSYLFKAAKQECELAYGDIGTILYLYKSDIDGAERWFKKAEKTGYFLAPAAFYYGLLLMIEKNEWEKCKKYFKQSAEEGFELAYAEYASILYSIRLMWIKQNSILKSRRKKLFVCSTCLYIWGVPYSGKK